MSQGTATKGGGDQTTNFLSTKSVKPFISSELQEMITNMIHFRAEGSKAYSYDATILPEICDSVLQARSSEEGLNHQQMHIAKQCEMIKVQAEALEKRLAEMNRLQDELVKKRLSDRALLLSLRDCVVLLGKDARIPNAALCTALQLGLVFYQNNLVPGMSLDTAQCLEGKPSLFEPAI